MTTDLINWKTNAWQQKDMVALYSSRMAESTHRLKHDVEMSLIGQWVVGQDMIDVGTGTGRSAIHFAEQGLKVLGVDSSQSMLDEARRLAGTTPLDLRLGDVTKVDVPDASFDTLTSLNVLVHFPHLEAILAEFKRIVRPGGRIIFDVHAFDHLVSIKGQAGAEEHVQQQDVGSYQRFASAEEIVRLADSLGLSVKMMAPYGLFCQRNHWIRHIQDKHWWRRMLEWIPHDKDMMSLTYALEAEVLARMPTNVCHRIMVALEHAPDPAGNQSWLDENARRIQGVLDWDDQVVAPDIARLQQAFGGMRGHRSMTLVYELLRYLVSQNPGLDWRVFFDADQAAVFAKWLQQDTVDRDMTIINTDWYKRSGQDISPAVFGTPIGATLEYRLITNLLTDYAKAFA
ncbi:MAG: class I SAM-dependent methyltransferase [Burkholderiales bacterium]|nr:class I SAM-dependent methyltransferase [Burkholderiales bacterium]